MRHLAGFHRWPRREGRGRPPSMVTPPPAPAVSLGLTPGQLAGLRQAMISVVERGTARGAAGRFGTITIAGKTGTAQNPHGPPHGWFIGFAPADKPEIVVGAIVEFAREGPYVAPLVARVIARYLGADSTEAPDIRLTLPTDTAPHPVQLLPGGAPDTAAPPPGAPPDTARAPPDTIAPAPPRDTGPAAAAPRDR